MTHRHRVHGEVAAHQIVLERVAEAHLRVAGHPVVAVGRNVVISSRWPPFAAPTVPNSIPVSHNASAHGRSNLLQLIGARVGSEVQIRAQPLHHRIAHRAAHQIQLVAGPSEQRAQLAQDVGMPVQRDRGGGQQLGVLGSFRHVESVVRLPGPFRPASSPDADNLVGDDTAAYIV